MNHIDISMAGLSVMIGMPTHRDINPLVIQSLFKTFEHCRSLDINCGFAFVWGGSVVTVDRDRVVDQFLESDASRLFWIDSDIIWESKDFIRMLALSTKRDVLCGAYPAKKEPGTFYIKFSTYEYDDYGLTEIDGIGLGFTVMTREVVEKLVATKPMMMNQTDDKEIPDLFRIDTVDGNLRTEDMAFFSDIKDLGYKVYLDPEVSLGHIGMKVYSGSIKDAMQ